MNNLFLTVGISIFVVLVAMALLGIGWLITGKSKVRLGMCGRDPTQKKNNECGKDISCAVCGKKEENEEEDK